VRLPRTIHRWNLTPAQAIALQRELAAQVREIPLRAAARYVAGVDAAFSSDGQWCVAAAVLWDLRERKILEQHVAARKLAFPYIPGLLSFREAPAELDVLCRLDRTPDVIMCDGHGRAHPRRFGIACHVGLLTGIPTIGCAKSLLVGEYAEPGRRRGSRAPLVDKGERVGTILRTRDGVKPVFVNVGNGITLREVEEIVLECGAGYRLPEPTRAADHLVGITSKSGRFPRPRR
jgi:deoxyribonuclease V